MDNFFKVDPRKILKQKGIILNKKQEQIVESVNKYRVSLAVCTRRGGKSEIASACAVAKLMEPGNYCGLVAPFMQQTDIVFSNVVDTFKDTLSIKPTKLNNKDRHLVLDWGSELRANTLRNRKAIAGRAYDIFVGDEIGLSDEENSLWLYQETLPAMITTAGHVLIISTPRGLNHLYDLWEAAAIEKDWNRIRYTIHECEHIPKEEIKNMERLYMERGMEKLWAQEFLAEFTSFDGAVFSFQPHIVKSSPDPDLIVTAIDPGSITGFIKCEIHKEFGVFVTFVSETTDSTLNHGKMLIEHTEHSDLNVYDPAAKSFAIDMTMEFDISLTKAKKDVEEGINFLRRLEGKLFVLDKCDDVFMREWGTYSMKNGKIVKKNDHTVDCIKMALYTAWKFWGDEFFPFLNDEVESLWEK